MQVVRTYLGRLSRPALSSPWVLIWALFISSALFCIVIFGPKMHHCLSPSPTTWWGQAVLTHIEILKLSRNAFFKLREMLNYVVECMQTLVWYQHYFNGQNIKFYPFKPEIHYEYKYINTHINKYIYDTVEIYILILLSLMLRNYMYNNIILSNKKEQEIFLPLKINRQRLDIGKDIYSFVPKVQWTTKRSTFFSLVKKKRYILKATTATMQDLNVFNYNQITTV